MSTTAELWDKIEYGGGVTDYDGCSLIPPVVADLLRSLVEDTATLAEGLQNLRELHAMRPPADAPAMTRAEALTAAREHVEAMATNTRGYQDGVRLPDKVAAVESFARFLMGEGESE